MPPISFGNPAIPFTFLSCLLIASMAGGDPLSFASRLLRESFYREMVINTFIKFLKRTEKNFL
jgi:hypothetical protein